MKIAAPLTMRFYQTEEDYWRIRQFLREVYLANGRRDLSWQAYRLDYARWHVVENIEKYRLEEHYFLWETPNGELAAVLNPESRGEVYLQIHPGRRTPNLEDEMLAAAEQRLAVPGENGQRFIRVWIHAENHSQRACLQQRGYTRGEDTEYLRRQPLDGAIPAAPAPAGYVIRPLGEVDELPRRSWVSWRAFHPDEPDAAYQGWQWYPNIQRCPLYRRDLDLVAAAPEGNFAAFCTVWFDDVTRSGAFEPVGTAPEHQQRGLGKALIQEGLRRLQRLGATQATVNAYSGRANALYAAAGFTTVDTAEAWEKTFS